MGSLLIILLVIFLVANSGKKNKRQGQANGKPRAGQAPRTKAATGPVKDLESLLEQAGGAAARAVRRPLPVTRAVNPSQIRQGEPMLADDDCHGGSMAHTHAEGHSALADEDCVGGSMAHTHTEGVSRADHARRMAAIDADRGETDVLGEAVDARALRRAVVMAEVLGKPRALRR